MRRKEILETFGKAEQHKRYKLTLFSQKNTVWRMQNKIERAKGIPRFSSVSFVSELKPQSLGNSL